MSRVGSQRWVYPEPCNSNSNSNSDSNSIKHPHTCKGHEVALQLWLWCAQHTGRCVLLHTTGRTRIHNLCHKTQARRPVGSTTQQHLHDMTASRQHSR
jgi:hypothetical protein